MDTITIILGGVLGCSTLVSFLLYRNASKRIKDAEADKAETEADKAEFGLYQERLTECHQTITTCNATIREQGALIAQLNRSLDGKTARIRQLTDQCYESERESNRINGLLNDVNTRLIVLTEERDRLMMERDKYQQWHCRKSDCDVRMPPNPLLYGKEF